MAGHVRKRGDKWYYSFEASTVDGKRKRIERVGGRTKKEAEAALRVALQEYENAGLHFEPSDISFADYLDYWYKSYCQVHLRYNTCASYANIINKHIKPVLGVYKLRSISAVVLQQFLNDKYLIGFSKSLLDDIRSVLKLSLNMAVQPYAFIKESPMIYVKLPRMDKSRMQVNRVVQTKETMAEIFEVCPRGSTYYIPVMIGYYTGMRIGEILGLTEDDIDLENATISISKILSYQNRKWVYSKPKTESSIRTIRIGDELKEALEWNRSWKNQNEERYGKYYAQYFISIIDEINDIWEIEKVRKTDPVNVQPVCLKENGEMITHNTMKYLSRKLNYGLNIVYNNHSLRHTHATLLLENNANPKNIQARLGHSRLDTLMNIYSHSTKNMDDVTIKIINECLPTKK